MTMNKNLLIVGAGIYGVVAKEIAESMNCFAKNDFVDDNRKETPNCIKVIGERGIIETTEKSIDFTRVVAG